MKDLPLKFSEEEIEELQKYWKSYVEKRISAKNIPLKIEDVIGQINTWIATVL